MDRAIHLDRQAQFGAVEVQHEIANRMLPTYPYAELIPTHRLPQHLLRSRRSLALLAGEIDFRTIRHALDRVLAGHEYPSPDAAWRRVLPLPVPERGGRLWELLFGLFALDDRDLLLAEAVERVNDAVDQRVRRRKGSVQLVESLH